MLISEEIGAVQKQRDACACLYNVFRATGRPGEALAYHERYLKLHDSLQVEETARRLEGMEYDKMRIADSLFAEERKVQAEDDL